jgi:hypothetical protein
MPVIIAGDREDRENFGEWATRASAWASHAHNLRISSELLWPHIQHMFDLNLAAPGSDEAAESLWKAGYGFGYLLLTGAALETMLKAAAIQIALNASGPSAVLAADGLSLQSWLTTHDLEKFAERAGIEVNEELRECLRRFTTYIEWAGRYPTPKKQSSWAATDRSSHPEHLIRDYDRDFFESLFEKAKAAYVRANLKQP